MPVNKIAHNTSSFECAFHLLWLLWSRAAATLQASQDDGQELYPSQ